MKYIITFAFGFYLGRRFYQNQQHWEKSKTYQSVENILKKIDASVKSDQ